MVNYNRQSMKYAILRKSLLKNMLYMGPTGFDVHERLG